MTKTTTVISATVRVRGENTPATVATLLDALTAALRSATIATDPTIARAV